MSLFRDYLSRLIRPSLAVFGSLVAAQFALAQSTLQDHPTPVTQSEINGLIKARDLGDSRLTTHYFWFEGSQGDVFINLSSKNFAGDVDLFVQNGLRLLTKIVVYADFGEVETGRVIYLRKPEKLLLRVQGRTPNDESATYRLKFAGSFVAAVPSEKDNAELPTVGENLGGPVKVNSVGTIVPPPPKPPATKTDAEIKSAEKAEATETAKSIPATKTDEVSTGNEERKETPKVEVVVEDPVKAEVPAKSTIAKRPSRRTRPIRTAATKKAEPKAKETIENSASDLKNNSEQASVDASAVKETKSEDKPKPAAKVDPLANVQLVIVFKDGRKIERPLPEVFRFSVDRGVLTVISKDGRVGKYQMVDVARVTIE